MSKVAVCFSMECMNSVAQTGKGVVVEHARLDDIFCPRCGHAIFWARVRDGETYDDYYNRKKRGATKRTENIESAKRNQKLQDT